MTSLKAMAAAKVNLFLELLSKRPDGYHELATLIETACNTLHEEGYDIISILPSVSGHSEKGVMSQGGYGFGFSITDGAVITARRKATE